MGQVRLVRPVVELGVDDVVGSILRVASDSDHLVNQRINRSLAAGIEACNEWLNLHQFDQWVLDVDVPLDGMRLYFHFLGEVDDRLEAATAGLVELFDRVTGVRGFTQAVLVGCGPTCGSDGSGCARTTTPAAGDGEAGGDGLGTAKAGGCQSCALSGGCKQK
jgi:hypothetical protein